MLGGVASAGLAAVLACVAGCWLAAPPVDSSSSGDGRRAGALALKHGHKVAPALPLVKHGEAEGGGDAAVAGAERSCVVQLHKDCTEGREGAGAQVPCLRMPVVERLEQQGQARSGGPSWQADAKQA